MYKDKDWLYQKYTIEELSSCEIADICGCNSCTIRYWLAKFDIHIRSAKEAGNTSSVKRRISKAKKLMWIAGIYDDMWTEEMRKAQSERMSRKFKNDPSLGKQCRENMASGLRLDSFGRRLFSSETRQKMSNSAQIRWKKNYKRYLEIYRSEECRKNHSAKAKELWAAGVYDGVYQSPTSIELKIEQGLQLLGFDYIFQYRPEEFTRVYDFYIPDHEILIEVNGDYWHDYNRFPKQKIRDVEKRNWAGENGYFFINFWEHEIHKLDTKELVLSHLPVHLQELYYGR